MIIIPDVHGRKFWERIIDNKPENEKIIFLGDYTDPYPIEGIEQNTIPDSIRKIIELKEKFPEDVILLLGNHDLSYVYSGLPKCRFDRERRQEIQDLFTKNRQYFQLAYKTGKYVFSHAGFLQYWIDTEDFYFQGLTNYEDIVNKLNSDWWDFNDSQLCNVLNCVSFWRGGYSQVGSCIWADVREFYTLDKLWDAEQMYQIFGHTRSKKEIITPEWAMLDARNIYKLNENTTTIKIFENE